jgi:hypothetical protein
MTQVIPEREPVFEKRFCAICRHPFLVDCLEREREGADWRKRIVCQRMQCGEEGEHRWRKDHERRPDRAAPALSRQQRRSPEQMIAQEGEGRMKRLWDWLKRSVTGTVREFRDDLFIEDKSEQREPPPDSLYQAIQSNGDWRVVRGGRIVLSFGQGAGAQTRAERFAVSLNENKTIRERYNGR